jgi:hypothetical protein
MDTRHTKRLEIRKVYVLKDYGPEAGFYNDPADNLESFYTLQIVPRDFCGGEGRLLYGLRMEADFQNPTIVDLTEKIGAIYDNLSSRKVTERVAILQMAVIGQQLIEAGFIKPISGKDGLVRAISQSHLNSDLLAA